MVPGDADVLVQVLALYTRLERPEQGRGARDEAPGDRTAATRRYALTAALRNASSARIARRSTISWPWACRQPLGPTRPWWCTKPCSTPPRPRRLRARAAADGRKRADALRGGVRRADALGRLGRPLEAAATFADAARLAEHPDERGAMLLAQAQQLIAGRDFEQARAVLRQVAEAGDGRSDDAAAVARNLVGAEVAQGGRPEAVEADVAAYLSAYGPDGRMLLQRALARLQAGRHADAVADLRAAARDDRLSDPERHLLREALLDRPWR